MEVEEEEVEVSRAEEGGRLIWRAPGAGLRERRGTGGSSRCRPLSVVIWRREGTGAGWGEAGRERGGRRGVGTGEGGERGGRCPAGTSSARRGGGGRARRISPSPPSPPLSAGARRCDGAAPARSRPGPRPTLSVAPLLPLPPTWGQAAAGSGEERKRGPPSPPSPSLFRTLGLSYRGLLCRKTLGSQRQRGRLSLSSISRSFFFPTFPAEPPGAERTAGTDGGEARGSERPPRSPELPYVISPPGHKLRLHLPLLRPVTAAPGLQSRRERGAKGKPPRG